MAHFAGVMYPSICTFHVTVKGAVVGSHQCGKRLSLDGREQERTSVGDCKVGKCGIVQSYKEAINITSVIVKLVLNL
jgi:hypothetical protein